jgi:hypothetical protein
VHSGSGVHEWGVVVAEDLEAEVNAAARVPAVHLAERRGY